MSVLPGATGATLEPLLTAGTPSWPVVKLFASLPCSSWRAAVSSFELGSV